MEQVKERFLSRLYWEAKKKPGWLSILSKKPWIDQESLDFMEDLDSHYFDVDKKLMAWDREIEKKFGPEFYLCEDDDEKIGILSQRISGVYDWIEKAFSEDRPFIEIKIKKAVCRLDEMVRERGKIRSRHIHKSENYTALPEWKIVQARQYPLEKYLGRKGYIICPFHDEKEPSFYLKGFGWCFSCNTWADSIKWCMEVEGMSFRQAVEHLCDR